MIYNKLEYINYTKKSQLKQTKCKNITYFVTTTPSLLLFPSLLPL